MVFFGAVSVLAFVTVANCGQVWYPSPQQWSQPQYYAPPHPSTFQLPSQWTPQISQPWTPQPQWNLPQPQWQPQINNFPQFRPIDNLDFSYLDSLFSKPTAELGPEDRVPGCETGMCAANYQPVCATKHDGTRKTYSNECAVDTKCYPKMFVKIEQGKCEDIKSSSTSQTGSSGNLGPEDRVPGCQSGMCAANYQPVCATKYDGTKQTFSNSCAYSNEAQCYPKKFTRTEQGRCEDIKSSSTSQTGSSGNLGPEDRINGCEIGGCGMNYQPVCATKYDGTKQTFSNSCAYSSQAKCYPRKFTNMVEGKCEESQPATRSDDSCIPPRMCPMNSLPICGVKADGTKQFFGNECMPDYHLKCTKTFTRFVYGNCENVGAPTATSEYVGRGRHTNAATPSSQSQTTTRNWEFY